MKKIIFLCTGNSARSQMAEGFARKLGEGLVEAFSAGVAPVGINPRTYKVMEEIGIDIRGQLSKGIDEALLKKMDIIVTLCSHAEERCPVTPPEIKRLHWPIDDPIRAMGTEEEKIESFRKVRDEIGRRAKDLIDELKNRGT
jgi:arsenate reductase